MKITLKKRIAILILGAMFAFCLAMAGVTVFKSQADSKVYPQNKVELYQLAPSENLYEGYIIKTSNDELVVIDGGAATDDNPAYIDAALRAIAGKEDYTVKYWFLSHAHDDHIYELAKILNFETIDFTIENIVFDFPKSFPATGAMSDVSKGALNLLKTGLDNYAEKKGLTYEATSYYEELNGKYVNEKSVLEGQTITVDNIDFEILQTWSTRDTQVNSNSMVIRMWVDGQSVLFLNDATVESGNRLIETYGREYLKSDIVQMAHHGQKGTAKNVYDAVDAKVRLWPCFSTVWVGSDTNTYQTKEVRSWVGLPEEASAFEPSEYDLVAALCESPSDVTSVPAWEQVLDGMKMELPYLPVYEHDFFMNEGASIRTNSDSTGIRFTATLTSYDPDTQYGFVIAPRSWLDALNVSENYAKSLIEEYGTEDDGVILLKSKVHQVYNHFEINGSIAKILDKNIGLDFVGIAYACKDEVYTDAYIGDLANVTRNVGQVAVAARNDYDKGGYEYDEDELKVIGDFISTSAGPSEITLAFTQETVEMTVFESKTLSLTSNVSTDNAIWSSSAPKVISVENGVATAHELGEAVITVTNAGVTATCTVTSVAEDNAIVSFSNDASEKIVRDVLPEVRPSRRAGGLVEAEWLESYKGAEGVVKVTSKAGVTGDYAGNYVADVRIELPVAIVEGATVKFYVENSDAEFFYFYDGTNYANLKSYYTNGNDVSMPETLKNCWSIVHIPYDESITDRSAINILIAGSSASYEHVFYIDVIEEGDTTANYTIIDLYGHISNPLKEKLETPYLADFSDDAYEKLIIDDTYGRVAEKIEAERLETYEGVKDVMKVTTYNDGSGSCFGDFTIVLPKAITDSNDDTEGYTVRFKIGSTSSTGPLRLLVPRSEVTPIKEYNPASSYEGQWVEVFVPYTGAYKNEVTFQIYGNKNGVNEFYIDYVADGNRVEEISAIRRQPIIDSLPEGYLADFSSESYNEFIVPNTYGANGTVAEKIVSEYVESYETETNLMKITTYNSNSTSYFGDFTIKLPKAMGSIGYTIRFMLVSTTSSGPLRINNPRTHVSKIKEYNPASSYVGKWIEVFVPYTGDYKNEVTFQIYGNKDGKNEFYIDYIADGNFIQRTNASKLAEGLSDGELANFSSEGYENIVDYQKYSYLGRSDSTAYKAASITAEQMSTYGNETDVLKVTTVSTNAGFSIALPKAIGDNGFTIRFMVESGMDSTGAIFRILNPFNYASKVWEKHNVGGTALKDIQGQWVTVYIKEYKATPPTGTTFTTADQKQYVEFQLYTSSSKTKVVYIDCILEGDQTALFN